MRPGAASTHAAVAGAAAAFFLQAIASCAAKTIVETLMRALRRKRVRAIASRRARWRAHPPMLILAKSTGGKRGEGCRRFRRTGGKIPHREGFGLSAFRAQRWARHHQRALRAKSAHRRAETLAAPRHGAKGVFINHEASRFSNDCYVCEIAPGKKLEPTHHLFEEMLLILSGRGSTTVWNNAGARITFEWKAGSIFAIPLNCWYQHFNGSGQERGAVRGRDQRAVRDQPLRRSQFHLQLSLRLQEPFFRRAGLFLRPRASRTAFCYAPISYPMPSTCR